MSVPIGRGGLWGLAVSIALWRVICWFSHVSHIPITSVWLIPNYTIYEKTDLPKVTERDSHLLTNVFFCNVVVYLFCRAAIIRYHKLVA